MSWIQNTGKSSLELRSDFFLASDAKRRIVVAATCFTLVQLDITTKRPAALFYDRTWAEQRYAYGMQSQIDSKAFTLPQNVLHTGWSSPPYYYAFDIRVMDEDQHGHVNSINFLLLIENAKHAYQQQQHSGLFDKVSCAETKSWIEYRSEVHRGHSNSAYILIQHQVANGGGNKLWLRYEFYNSNVNTPSTVVYVENTLTNNKL